MIFIKKTVKPKSLVILAAFANTCEQFGNQGYVTSGNDSEHKKNSLHYTNNALDFRSKTFVDKHAVMAALRHRLGPDYQVLLEDEGLPNEHFHIEYDQVKHATTDTRV